MRIKLDNGYLNVFLHRDVPELQIEKFYFYVYNYTLDFKNNQVKKENNTGNYLDL